MKRALEQDRRPEQAVKPAAETELPGSAARLSSSKSAELRPGESDDAIIERIRNGDVNAFEVLVRRYDRWIFGIVAKRVARDQVAEIAQEVFIHAYQSLPNYRLNPSADGFRQWLATIAARRCCDYWRVVNRHPTCAVGNLNATDTEQMEQLLQATACETVQSEMDLDRMRETSREAMDQIEADDRTLLWLLYWEGHSIQETATILGYSPGNVRVRASRARALLSQLMNPSTSPPTVAMPQALPAGRTNECFSLESTLVPA